MVLGVALLILIGFASATTGTAIGYAVTNSSMKSTRQKRRKISRSHIERVVRRVEPVATELTTIDEEYTDVFRDQAHTPYHPHND